MSEIEDTNSREYRIGIMNKKALSLSKEYSSNAQRLKYLNNILTAFVIIVGTFITASAFTSITVIVKYLVPIAGLTITVVKSLTTIFNIERYSLAYMQAYIQITEIIAILNILSRVDDEEVLDRKLLKYQNKISLIELNVCC